MHIVRLLCDTDSFSPSPENLPYRAPLVVLGNHVRILQSSHDKFNFLSSSSLKSSTKLEIWRDNIY